MITVFLKEIILPCNCSGRTIRAVPTAKLSFESDLNIRMFRRRIPIATALNAERATREM